MTEQYAGGCHCGSVRFEVQTQLKKLVVCNCSICARAGWRLAFAPASNFNLLSGASDLTDYQFGKKNTHHVFCKHCGVRSFSRGKGADGKETVAVNVRCLDDVDAESFDVMHFDGKSM